MPEAMVILGLFLPWKLGFCFISSRFSVGFTETFGGHAAVVNVNLSLKYLNTFES